MDRTRTSTEVRWIGWTHKPVCIAMFTCVCDRRAEAIIHILFSSLFFGYIEWGMPYLSFHFAFFFLECPGTHTHRYHTHVSTSWCRRRSWMRTRCATIAAGIYSRSNKMCWKGILFYCTYSRYILSRSTESPFSAAVSRISIHLLLGGADIMIFVSIYLYSTTTQTNSFALSSREVVSTSIEVYSSLHANEE